MGEITIVGPGKTRGYPYPVCKKTQFHMVKGIINDFDHMEFCLVINLTIGGNRTVT